MTKWQGFIVILAFFFLFLPSVLFATEDISTNFKVLDPVIYSGWGAVESASQNFKLRDVIGQPGIGLSDSATLYGLKAGFLYYPAPTVAAAEEEAATVSTGEGIIMTLLRQFVPYMPLPSLPTTPCGTDFNCDGKVDLSDLSIFLYLESKSTPSPADFNRDAKVDTSDLSIFLLDLTEQVATFIPEHRFLAVESKPLEKRLEHPISAAAVETLLPKEEVPHPTIFEQAAEFIGKVFEKIMIFFKRIF